MKTKTVQITLALAAMLTTQMNFHFRGVEGTSLSSVGTENTSSTPFSVKYMGSGSQENADSKFGARYDAPSSAQAANFQALSADKNIVVSTDPSALSDTTTEDAAEEAADPAGVDTDGAEKETIAAEEEANNDSGTAGAAGTGIQPTAPATTQVQSQQNAVQQALIAKFRAASVENQKFVDAYDKAKEDLAIKTEVVRAAEEALAADATNVTKKTALDGARKNMFAAETAVVSAEQALLASITKWQDAKDKADAAGVNTVAVAQSAAILAVPSHIDICGVSKKINIAYTEDQKSLTATMESDCSDCAKKGAVVMPTSDVQNKDLAAITALLTAQLAPQCKDDKESVVQESVNLETCLARKQKTSQIRCMVDSIRKLGFEKDSSGNSITNLQDFLSLLDDSLAPMFELLGGLADSSDQADNRTASKGQASAARAISDLIKKAQQHYTKGKTLTSDERKDLSETIKEYNDQFKEIKARADYKYAENGYNQQVQDLSDKRNIVAQAYNKADQNTKSLMYQFMKNYSDADAKGLSPYAKAQYAQMMYQQLSSMGASQAVQIMTRWTQLIEERGQLIAQTQKDLEQGELKNLMAVATDNQVKVNAQAGYAKLQKSINSLTDFSYMGELNAISGQAQSTAVVVTPTAGTVANLPGIMGRFESTQGLGRLNGDKALSPSEIPQAVVLTPTNALTGVLALPPARTPQTPGTNVSSSTPVLGRPVR